MNAAVASSTGTWCSFIKEAGKRSQPGSLIHGVWREVVELEAAWADLIQHTEELKAENEMLRRRLGVTSVE